MHERDTRFYSDCNKFAVARFIASANGILRLCDLVRPKIGAQLGQQIKSRSDARKPETISRIQMMRVKYSDDDAAMTPRVTKENTSEAVHLLDSRCTFRSSLQNDSRILVEVDLVHPARTCS